MNLWQVYGRSVAGPDEVTSRRLERTVLGRVAVRPRGGRWATPVLVAAAAVLVAALTLVVLRPWSTTPAPALVMVSTTGHAQELGLPRDGVLRVGPDSRVGLQASDETGAVVRLLEGEVTLQVRAAEGMRWVVEADGFSVEAVGTRFSVRRTGVVPDVHVTEGTVRLMGPGLPAQGVRMSAATWAGDPIDDGRDQAAAAPGPIVVAQDNEMLPKDPPSRAENTETDTPGSRLEPPPQPAWIGRFRTAVDAGDAKQAVAALPSVFPTGREPLSAADFLDAGDALASQRQTERAGRAYEAACRRRDRAACGVATFRLALIAARRSDLTTAIELSTRYLADHPRGSLRREVLGRRMQWHEATRDLHSARNDARRYLASWPDGPHAALARRILGEHHETP